MNVKAQVVEGQLGGLFLQLPGESDLPAARKTQTHLYERLRLHALKAYIRIWFGPTTQNTVLQCSVCSIFQKLRW